MLDCIPKAPELRMSRKRTRSKSEDIMLGEASSSNSIRPPTTASICKPAPFSEDPESVRVRNDCNYAIRITKEMAVAGKAPRPVRVYADGAFDLFHQGHARILMQAKNAFPNVHLIVGVCSDRMLHRKKGKTVLDEDERYSALQHCRYVDEVLRNAPWQITDPFLAKHKIDFVAHDDIPYGSDTTDDIYGDLKERGMFVATERTEGVSTSDIVARIVRDYDLYVRRNLARGYSAKELNVSFIKEKKFKFQNQMDRLKDKGKKVMDSIGERTDDIIAKWEDKSRDFIDSFLMLFSNKNPFVNIWNGGKEKIMRALTPPGTPMMRSRQNSREDDENDYTPRPKKMRRVL